MRILTIIPARYASTRFPGKPLAKIGDKEMILHVLERASRISPSLYVATDDDRIASCVRQAGYEAIMTSSDLRSGTERCIQAYKRLGQEADILVNLQGDEPFIAAEHIELLLAAFEDPEVDIATLAQPFGEKCSDEELANPNAVKVVRGQRGQALYFSRSVIPYLRGTKESWARQHRYLKHIGLYAFRTNILPQLQQLPDSPLELAESLEQLRWLDAGYRIQVQYTELGTVGIDTPEDLEELSALILERGHTQD